ncbi:MAG: DUF4350 domain-containing protein [Pirellulaceae bacterium]|nr:DUF4350 domain-containing protein [Pirellulaceae bacterium]
MSNKHDLRDKRPGKQGSPRGRDDLYDRGPGSAYGVGVGWPTAIGAAGGVLAAWIAADSTGLLVGPLRLALVALLLGVVVVVSRPTWRRLSAIAPAIVGALAVSWLGGGLPAIDVLGVAAILGVIAATAGEERRVWSIVATAAAALALFRLACFSAPLVWTLDQTLGQGMGRLARPFAGHSLWIGGAFGGLDLLVLMAVLYAAWLRATRPPRRARAIYAAVAILLVQAVYLVGLSHALDVAHALPERPVPNSLDPGEYRPTDWKASAEPRDALPWNVPLLAALLQAGVAVAMLRWTRIEPDDRQERDDRVTPGQGQTGQQGRSDSASPAESPARPASAGRLARWLLPIGIVLAAVSVVLSCWSPRAGDLSGKKVLAWSGGYVDVDWNVPTHDALGAHQTGTYGLLPGLVANLGGQWIASDELTDEELKEADVLLVIHPVSEWPDDRLERVEKFVRQGGSLLVSANPMVENEVNERLIATRERSAAGSHTDPESPAEETMLGTNLRPVNRLLRPTGMAFRHDEAFAPTQAWAGALAASTHPAVFGLSQRTRALGLRKSGSIDMPLLARPILIGRWAWSEPGGDRLYSGYVEPDPGEAWGDLVLAAERPLGSGAVVALADTWSLTNLGMADGHEMAGRLLSYLAHRPGSPQATWRQILASLGYAVLLILVVRRPNPWRTVAIVSTLAIVLTIAVLDARAGGPVPATPGTSMAPSESNAARPIAYVDASHLEMGNDRAWSNDGIDGFLLTLARNGYLPLKLHQWNRSRLDQASLLVIMAPRRPFSAGQIEDIRKFVDGGGHVVCMIGATEAAPARTLLDAFQFTLDPSPSPTGSKTPEAEPMGVYPEEFGSFFAMYMLRSEQGRDARVLVASGWPVGCGDDNRQVLVHGYHGQPLVIRRFFGQTHGQIVLIGDSRFALNANHGYYHGELTDSAEDNAHFWRWLFSRIRGGPAWMPPDPQFQNRQTSAPTRREVHR